MATDFTNLASVLTSAARRHDDMVVAYPQACQKLLNEIYQVAEAIRTPDGRKHIFNVRLEKEKDAMALIIKSNLTNKGHIIGTHVLNFETRGIGYHPSNGALCGFVELILSSGDYWDLFRRSKVNPLLGIAVGMVSRSAASGMYERKRHQLDSVQDISRELIDLYWTWADEPGKWYWTTPIDGAVQLLDIKEYMLKVLDGVFNPEFKEWVYKSDAENE